MAASLRKQRRQSCISADARCAPRQWTVADGRAQRVHRSPRTGRGGGEPYSIAKAGIAHYTRVLAAELGPHGVNVNCIAPGYIMSSRKVSEGMGQGGSAEKEQIALGRLRTPEDCAKVVEFLCTDLADYVTGQCISVCGAIVI